MTKKPARGAVPAVKINGNYVNIPGVDGIPRLGGGTKAEYENTAINENARTYGTDLRTPPTAALSGSWDSKDAAHVYLLASAANVNAEEEFQVTYNSGAIIRSNVKVMSFDVDAEGGKDERFYCDLKLTGVVNVTAAT
jgi:hypothetical protein